ncbi:MAG: restriction endonuclease [Euryarchaeota archaeon]|nr:restriction endonuclease [Euryarchaeota archaeon]MBU4144129.1 hypothetical protein [Candidatus Thermoplasmatota archaeon]
MQKDQARGYYLEEIVRILMAKTGCINVESGKIPGRGANHQIDSYGILTFPSLFTHRVRLIAEVKWFNARKKIKLEHIRNFTGVMKDISENYFVPGELRDHDLNDVKLKERFNDCAVFFSPNAYTRDAQHYAWAQNIYLVHLSNSGPFSQLVNRVEELLQGINYKKLNQQQIYKIAKNHSLEDKILQEMLNNTYSYIAMIDGIYPTLLVTDGALNLANNMGDDIHADAHKTYREEFKEHIDFHFTIEDSRFTLSLPTIIAEKLVNSINKNKVEPFAYLDIYTLAPYPNIGGPSIRRIFRLSLKLQGI